MLHRESLLRLWLCSVPEFHVPCFAVRSAPEVIVVGLLDHAIEPVSEQPPVFLASSMGHLHGRLR